MITEQYKDKVFFSQLLRTDSSFGFRLQAV